LSGLLTASLKPADTATTTTTIIIIVVITTAAATTLSMPFYRHLVSKVIGHKPVFREEFCSSTLLFFLVPF
jgi:hypothetical protein